MGKKDRPRTTASNQRGFFTEGFATRESVSLAGDGRQIIIESDQIENGPDGMSIRRTLTFEGEDELVDLFEISMPGIGYRTYRTVHLRRVAEN